MIYLERKRELTTQKILKRGREVCIIYKNLLTSTRIKINNNYLSKFTDFLIFLENSPKINIILLINFIIRISTNFLANFKFHRSFFKLINLNYTGRFLIIDENNKSTKKINKKK